MKKIKITHSFQASRDWDSYLERTVSKSDLLQSKYWADVMKGLGRGEPLFLRVTIDDVLVGQMLIIQQCIPISNKFWKGLLNKLGYQFYRIDMTDLACVSNAESQVEVFNAIFDWVKIYAAKKRIFWIRIQGSPANRISSASNFPFIQKNGYSSKKWGTYQVELKKDENSLLYSFDHSVRKGINKSLRSDIQIIKISEWSQFNNDFLLPYINWSNKKEQAQYLLDESKLVWAHPQHSDYYSYFVAKNSKGRVLGVLGTYSFGCVSTEIFSANSPEAIQLKIPVQDHLHWVAMLSSKGEGMQIFDLAGVAPSPINLKEENIKRFKKKWGGQYLEYAIHEWMHPALKFIKFVRGCRNQKVIA